MREADMKDKVEKYEFIYDVPPEEKLSYPVKEVI